MSKNSKTPSPAVMTTAHKNAVTLFEKFHAKQLEDLMTRNEIKSLRDRDDLVEIQNYGNCVHIVCVKEKMRKESLEDDSKPFDESDSCILAAMKAKKNVYEPKYEDDQYVCHYIDIVYNKEQNVQTFATTQKKSPGSSNAKPSQMNTPQSNARPV